MAIDPNLEHHAIVEKEAIELEYGQMTVNTYIKSHKTVNSTLNIIKQKRIKYKVSPKQ